MAISCKGQIAGAFADRHSRAAVQAHTHCCCTLYSTIIIMKPSTYIYTQALSHGVYFWPYIHIPFSRQPTDRVPPPGWPLQDILLLRGFCARINHPSIAPSYLHCPHYCNTIARLLRNIRRPSDPPFVCHTKHNIGNNNIV